MWVTILVYTERDKLGNVRVASAFAVAASKFSICELSLTSSVSYLSVSHFLITPVTSELSGVDDILHGRVWGRVMTPSQGSPHVIAWEGCLAPIWLGIFPRAFTAVKI
jgi:hypothetical protein